MSLRTRRSLTFMASLTLLAVACTGGTVTPTTAPGTTTPATTAPVTPVPATLAPDQTATAAPPATETPVETPGDTAAPSGGTLRVYCCANDWRSLRPQAASGSDEISILSATQRGLLYYDGTNPDVLNVVPALATDLPVISDDLLTYTFTLGDHNYSDGTPIVAADFVRAAQQLADPRNAFDYGYEMCWLAGVPDILGTGFGCSSGTTLPLPAQPFTNTPEDQAIDAALQGIGVTAPDEHTVVFTLNTPTSFWNNIVAMWLLTPVHPDQTSWAEAGDFKSSGPFMVESWTHQSQMVLVPNPQWNGEPPKVDRIEVAIGGSLTVALAAFERGDLDLVPVPSEERRRILDDPELSPLTNRSTTLSIEYYDFANCVAEDADGNILCPPNAAVGGDARVPAGSPSQNVHFRRAMTMAIDKAELIQIGFAGFGQAAYSPTMPGIPGFPAITDADAEFKFDLTAAATEMQTALDELGIPQPDPATVLATDCPAGIDPPLDSADPNGDAATRAECVGRARVKLLSPVRFGYNCDANHDQRVLYMAQKWRENLGFSGTQMDIRCTDFGTFRTERRAGNIYDIARNGWGADFPHPDNQNRDLFACGAGNNNSKYCNPDYDALLNQGATAASYDEALPFYQDAEKLLAQDAPVFFMEYGEGLRLIRPWVTGFAQTAQDSANVGDRFPEYYVVAPH